MTTVYKNERQERQHLTAPTQKWRVQCLNEVLCFVSSSVLAESFVLRNRQLLIAAKRWAEIKAVLSSNPNWHDSKYHCPNFLSNNCWENTKINFSI